jgi:hypothetical protein
MNDEYISPVAYSVLRALARRSRQITFFESVAEQEAVAWLLKSGLAETDRQSGAVSASVKGRSVGRLESLDS